MTFIFISIKAAKYNITTKVTYTAKKELSDPIKDELANIIESVLKVDSSDVALKVNTDSKQRTKSSFVIVLAIKTSNYDIVDSLKDDNFIKNVTIAIGKQETDAVKEVILESIDITECQGCGKYS